MASARTSGDRVWQRMPQGWIEFRSFGDRTPDDWLEWYLASGEGWLPDAARSAIVDGFRAGVAAFAGTDFDSAGVSITLGERPAVTFLCTNVARVSPEADAPSLEFHRLFPLARFGVDSAAETFTAPDGRVGTVAAGRLTLGGSEVITAVGEIRLPAGDGTILVMGMCSDPAQRAQLSVLAAFTLATTQVLPAGVEPAPLEGPGASAPASTA
jgi:hypothetical protein